MFTRIQKEKSMENFDLNLTLILISIIAPIGAFDVVYFHIYKLKLATRPESWAETQTHIVRSFLLGVVALFLALYRPQGLWFWFIGGLFVFDFFNNALDAYLEFNSRKKENGLPQFEYLIHIAGATWMGAVALSYFAIGWGAHQLPTQLISVGSSIPQFLKFNMYFVAAGSFALALYELLVMQKSKLQHT